MATLVVIDMQNVFVDPASPWASPQADQARARARELVGEFTDHTVLTRFVAPTEPAGAWIDYFDAWPFAQQPSDASIYQLIDEFAATTHPVVTATTFSKWVPELAALVEDEIILCGLATDCCVLATALAAADAGRRVRVVTDACAGSTLVDHDRALAAMALFAPLIELTTSQAVLAERRRTQ